MAYPTHHDLNVRWATQAKEAYAEGLVGQLLPCGCHIGLGKNAVVCDDSCHTAWNIVYRNERLNVVETSNPWSDPARSSVNDFVDTCAVVFRDRAGSSFSSEDPTNE